MSLGSNGQSVPLMIFQRVLETLCKVWKLPTGPVVESTKVQQKGTLALHINLLAFRWNGPKEFQGDAIFIKEGKSLHQQTRIWVCHLKSMGPCRAHRLLVRLWASRLISRAPKQELSVDNGVIFE